MGYVVGYTAAAPLRAEAAHRSEMVSQLLFGETAEILDTTKDFIKLRCSYDGYDGWCQRTQLVEIPDEQATAAGRNLAAGYTNPLELNGSPMQIPMGASLGLFNNNTARIGPFHFAYLGAVADPDTARFEPDQIRRIAAAYLHTPYLWGGRSVFGIDCSGYAQQVYRFFNKTLPRDAYQQAELGEIVGFLQEAVTGDLAFFDNDEGRITHVGILLDSETIIHSSGKVRIDKIDNMGIISSDTGERTHRLRLMKTYR
ncbi:MAG: C40 family peptidase [Sediminibacterium sp.]